MKKIPVTPSPVLARLLLEPAGPKRFVVRVPQGRRVGLYTQHLPSEFNLHLLQAGASVSPRTEREFAPSHEHDAEVSSVGIQLRGAVDGERMNKWLSTLLRERGTDIFRMKGIVDVAGSVNRYVFQGVHMLLDGREERPWGDNPRTNDLVFIGRKLDRDELMRGFERCRA